MKKLLFGIKLGNTGWSSGCENAPDKIKSLIDNYCPDLYNLANYDSISFNPGISTDHKLKLISTKYRDLYTKYKKILSLGGDHLISLPILEILSEKQNITYVYLDAHLDYYDDTPNYNWNIVKKIKNLNIDVINIGFRNFIDESVPNELKCISLMDEINIKKVINKLQKLVSKNSNIYLSIDFDILEPLLFPYVNSPVSCGLTSKELFILVKELLNTFNIVGIDMNEYNPQNDLQGTGTHFIRFLIDYILHEWENNV